MPAERLLPPAEVRPEAVIHESSVSLDSELQRRGGQFGIPAVGEHNISVHFSCDGMMAGYLRESPLADNQRLIAKSDGWYDVHATLVDSWELRWWLVSRSASVEVIAPKALRREVVLALRQGLDRYGG